MTDISIVIRTKNEGKNLQSTLEKIFSQKIDKDFEVIIVDSGSTDNTLEIAKKFNCRILKIPSEKFTYPYALNFGTENANGNLIVYLSAHCPAVNNYWLYHLTKHFSDPNVAGVFGREIPIKGLNPVYEYFQLSEMFPSNGNTYILFSNANSCIRKKVWEKYKFDERVPKKRKQILLIGEDQIWAKEVKKRGYKIVYEPQSIVYHSHKFSMKNLTRAYSGGYFFKELSFSSPVLSEKSFWKQIAIYIRRQINVFNYLIKNHYFKAIFWDFLLTIFFGIFWYYLGKRDRKREDLQNKFFDDNPS